MLYVSCPQAAPVGVRAHLLGLPGAHIVVSLTAPVWKIDDREEYAYVRDNPQLLRWSILTDPWTWYAAVWARAQKAKGRALASLSVWGRGSTSFKAFVYGATHPEHVAEAPQPLGVTWAPDDAGGWRGLLASTLGLCSFTALYHCGTKPSWQTPDTRPVFGVDVFVDGHRADAALQDMLTLPTGRTPLALPQMAEAAQAALAASYDTDMVRWVAEADRPICTLMGYETPFLPGTAAHTVSVRSFGFTRRGPGRLLTADERWHVGKARYDRRRATPD